MYSNSVNMKYSYYIKTISILILFMAGFWAVLVENGMSHHSLVALLYAFINSCNKVEIGVDRSHLNASI
jgi:hypothetical protein